MPSLAAIHQSQHTVVGVVSQPDRPRGRGRKLLPTPVKQFALDQNLAPVLQPEKMKQPDFIDVLTTLRADLFVVVAFRILPEVVFSMPPYGTINLHPSLLPLYRGAAPLNWAIINGDRQTGITTMFIQKQIDAGNMILQEETALSEDETVGMLHDRLAERGAQLLLESIDRIAAGTVTLQQQDSTLATPAPKISKEDCRLRFDQPAAAVRNWIHGLSPLPGAYAAWEEQVVKMYRARVISEADAGVSPGTVVRAEGTALHIACRPGIVAIDHLKIAGRRAMDTADFLRGVKIESGARFQ